MQVAALKRFELAGRLIMEHIQTLYAEVDDDRETVAPVVQRDCLGGKVLRSAACQTLKSRTNRRVSFAGAGHVSKAVCSRLWQRNKQHININININRGSDRNSNSNMLNLLIFEGWDQDS